jgi:hypothetical protein
VCVTKSILVAEASRNCDATAENQGRGRYFLPRAWKELRFSFQKREMPSQSTNRLLRKELADSQLFNFAVERREADVQQLGGFLAILPDLLQHSENVLFFELPGRVL